METQALAVSCPRSTMLDEPLRFGVSTPGGFLGAGELQAVADAVGRRAEMVMAFEDFFATPPIAELAVVKYCGADPIITWEPWCWTDDRSPAVVQSVLSGALDDYASRWADEIRDWASTVYVRFAHEFNGDWYPWTPTYGTSARAYVEAWRRLRDIFANRGAGNVKWVWAPSAVGASTLRDWYPGDDYVDVLGIDGYNWGASHRSTRWITPEELFGDALHALRAVSPDKPILISEVGCAESGGCKADWIAHFMDFVVAARDVMGFVWFEHDKEPDWRITSTPESAAAMAKALRKNRFGRT
jgi:mannan endo-1,4-beta-mannosidase